MCLPALGVLLDGEIYSKLSAFVFPTNKKMSWKWENLWGVKFAIEFVIYQDTKGREAHEQVRNGLLFRQVFNRLKNHGTRAELWPEPFQNLTRLE